MFLISHLKNSWVSFFEFLFYAPLSWILIFRFLKFRRHESWKINTTLRALWYVQLVLVVNLFFSSFLFMVHGLLNEGHLQEFTMNFRYALGQAWFYLFAAIQLLTVLLVSKTVLKCRKEKTSHLKVYRYGFIIPVVTYISNMAMLFNHGKDPLISERNASILSNTGGLLVTSMSLFCTFWLVKEFTKLIEEIKKQEYSRIKNKANIRRWKIYLIANLSISVGIFTYSILDNVDELFTLGLLSKYDYDSDEPGYIDYCLSRFINTILKYILSCILVFLSPYTSLKVNHKRKVDVNESEENVKCETIESN
eukprot:GAHX01002862.1.p1 GENE.GAHX01002862.1~~GAHX01002862.1.p1  ORF type:complete len:308 (-),score=15.20 GAHX01002862.1:663-1586(-)